LREYLVFLHFKYEEWIEKLKWDATDWHVLEIDGNQDYRTSPELKKKLLAEIRSFIK